MKNQAREEADIIAMSPVSVKFGDKDYDVQVLRITPAREWRKKLIDEVQAIAAQMQVSSSNSDKFYGSLAYVFLQFPEKLADLVFSYAPDLPRETIEAEATEEQLAKAFGQIVQVAFPFLGELQTVSSTLGMAAAFHG